MGRNGLLVKGIMTMAVLNGFATAGAEVERHALTYQSNETAWQFLGDRPWRTNDAGHLICPADNYWAMDTYHAFYTKQSYGDCAVSGKWQFRYGGGAGPELIVRAMDSRRFYAVRFNLQMNMPHRDKFVMVSIWKGGDDGYTRMLAYRRKVGIYRTPEQYTKWYDVRVECVGSEIIVFFDDAFVCAVKDDEYPAGVAGIDRTFGLCAWKDLVVEGSPVAMEPVWSISETRNAQAIPSLPGYRDVGGGHAPAQ